ncbi:WD40-repeat-containing domain [Trinorchestia longiramus]|nr:WD40-repeat-containing domain [Trinorchestia longiramus]
MLVADALRLGGAILSSHPDMLAAQLVGRLLPEMHNNPHVKMLLQQCDEEGMHHCALMPTYHCMHTPGGPLKVVPEIEGILQDLTLSPDNKYAVAHTNNNLVVLLNMLTSEFFRLHDPLDGETVKASLLTDTHCIIHGTQSWVVYNLRGQLQDKVTSPWTDHIVSMELKSVQEYSAITADSDDPQCMTLRTVTTTGDLKPLTFYNALCRGEESEELYCCSSDHNVTLYKQGQQEWEASLTLANSTPLLQLLLDFDNENLIGTCMMGFKVWQVVDDKKTWNLLLPHGIRNISTQPLTSNSCIISKGHDYAVAGVRKNLYVWSLEDEGLVKVLDAHFGRIISMVALTVRDWNSVITSSLDRSVKVWNINNIFEQVHVIDRHELQVDHIWYVVVFLFSGTRKYKGLIFTRELTVFSIFLPWSVSPTLPLAVTVTRNSIGLWNTRLGKLTCRLADSPLGAIVTLADITSDSRYIVSTESGNVLVWNVKTKSVEFRAEERNVLQLLLIDGDTKFLAICRSSGEDVCRVVARNIPDGGLVYELAITFRLFKLPTVTADGLLLVVPSADGMKDILYVYHAKTGTQLHKMVLKYPGYKDFQAVTPMPNRPSQVVLIDPDKGNIVDVRSKKFIRSINKWGGKVTSDGRFGLFAPARGGLELLELRHGTSIHTLIPRVAEGVFAVICMFTKTDEYVLYYHGGRKTIRVFRVADGELIANFRVQAELTAIACTNSSDGESIVLGTVDGCVSCLTIVDPAKPSAKHLLANLPSRDLKLRRPLDHRESCATVTSMFGRLKNVP